MNPTILIISMNMKTKKLKQFISRSIFGFALALSQPAIPSNAEEITFKEGISNPIEIQYGVDLQGNFSPSEVQDIEFVLGELKSKLGTIKNKYLIIQKVPKLTTDFTYGDANPNYAGITDSLSTSCLGATDSYDEIKQLVSEYAIQALTNQPFAMIRLIPKEKMESTDPLYSFQGTFAHELGHIVTLSEDNLSKGLEQKFSAINNTINNEAEELPLGYLTQHGFVSRKEIIDNKTQLDSLFADFRINEETHKKEIENDKERLEDKLHTLRRFSSAVHALSDSCTMGDYKQFLTDFSDYIDSSSVQLSLESWGLTINYWENSHPNEPFLPARFLKEMLSRSTELEINSLTEKLEKNDGLAKQHKIIKVATEIEEVRLAMKRNIKAEAEDQADIFAYWLLECNYADSDSLVTKKVKILDKSLSTFYKN